MPTAKPTACAVGFCFLEAILFCCCCLASLQEPTGLRDEVDDFKRFHQGCNSISLQVIADFLLGNARECEHHLLLETRTSHSNPAMRVLRAPPAGHSSIHADGVKAFRPKTVLCLLHIHQGHDLRPGPPQNIALELENGFFVLQEKHATLDCHLSPSRGSHRLALNHVSRRRQPDLHRSTTLWTVMRGNVASVLFDDSVADA